ncbi:unnamed protein product [Mytilus edulis]|uniref:Paraneoplastic antigen Ma-like C-terminal domain-containing protein n=1 Tax=Mytilus edulis TaxID=6550 RepID=A0A8S3QAZ8_MYTED|nr:unnamed protein product [Mytilus edulis]
MSDYLSKDEISNIVMAFKEMDLKPCAQTPDDFKTWMEDYKDTDDDLWNTYLPRISAFSGDAKTGTPYDLWRYEVQCLIKTGHTHETITMAIRRSLRGDASKVPMRLGPEATIDDIIDKMDSIYGSVDQPEALLGQFYTARQQDDEDVATWACRLEEILSKAKNRKNITEENINDMLTSKFFDGLRPELKNIVRYKKDTITDFHSLLKATREIENQHNLKPSLKKKPPTQATSKSMTTTVENRQIQQLTALVKQLSQDVKALKEDRNCDQPSTNIQWSRRDTSWTPYHPDETTIYRPVEQHRRRKQNDFTCKNNADADGLSRLPGIHTKPDNISEESVKAICSLVQPVAYVESLSHQPDALDNMPDMPKEHQINIRDEQMNDSTIGYWIDKVSSKMKPRKQDVPSLPFHNMLINEELVEENTTHQIPVSLPRRSKRKPASPKKKPAPVEVSTDSNTESEDESMVYVVVEEPQQEVQQDIQPDDVIQADDEIASVEEEATVPGNADDDQDRTEEHSELEEDASLPEESGGSEHETSLDDQVHDLATDALHDVTDDDSKEDENIDDDEENDDDISTPETQQRRSTRTKTSTATTKYKDFVVPSVSKRAQPEWMVRADYLRTAASSGMFINMADEVSRAMLKLITKPDD